MQIAAFNELRAEFIKAGVGVHHITAEGGGSEAVLKRLAERGLRPGCTRRVTQPLHSDPEWKLMVVEPKDEVYIGSPIAPALTCVACLARGDAPRQQREEEGVAGLAKPSKTDY